MPGFWTKEQVLAIPLGRIVRHAVLERFSDIAGIRITSASRVDGELPGYQLHFPGQTATYAPLRNMEKIEVSTATVLASIARPDETPLAALTANSTGKGLVVYFGAASADLAFYEESFRRIQEMVGLTAILEVPPGIEVVSRVAAGREYVFVQNFLPTAQSVALPRPSRDAVTNALCHGSVTLEPFDVKVLFTEP